jgi:hypothetical protein
MPWISASKRLPCDQAKVWVRIEGNVELALYVKRDRRFYSDETWFDEGAPELMWSFERLVGFEIIIRDMPREKWREN